MIYFIKPSDISTNAMFLYFNLCAECYSNEAKIYSTLTTNDISDVLGLEDAFIDGAIKELVSRGLLVIEGTDYLLGKSGTLFDIKPLKKIVVRKPSITVEDPLLTEIPKAFTDAVQHYKNTSVRYTDYIEDIVSKVKETLSKKSVKPGESALVFQYIYEIIYQEAGRGRAAIKKEIFIHRSLLNTYDFPLLFNMFVTFLSNVPKYFSNGSPNITTFNVVKDKVYLDTVKKPIPTSTKTATKTYSYE